MIDSNPTLFRHYRFFWQSLRHQHIGKDIWRAMLAKLSVADSCRIHLENVLNSATVKRRGGACRNSAKGQLCVLFVCLSWLCFLQNKYNTEERLSVWLSLEWKQMWSLAVVLCVCREPARPWQGPGLCEEVSPGPGWRRADPRPTRDPGQPLLLLQAGRSLCGEFSWRVSGTEQVTGAFTVHELNPSD